MRTAGAGMIAHLAGASHRRARCLRLELDDGTIIGVTDHDEDLAYDLGDGEVTYVAGTGMQLSDIVLAQGFDSDSYEVTGPIGDLVTREAIIGGRFDGAVARLFVLRWDDLTAGALRFHSGSVSAGTARVEGDRFVLEILSDIARYGQTVGSQITNQCRADYGDARCQATVETIEGTVTAVASSRAFTVSFTGSYANAFFDKGEVEATSGDLVGTRPVEIKNWLADGSITLFEPLAEAPQIGDTFDIRRGCGRTRADCMERNNILNFRGEPEVPGNDQYFRPAIPGQSNG